MPGSAIARVLVRALSLTATAGLVLVPSSAALAHGDATSGEVELVVGFAEEPAYTGLPNAVQVVVRHGGEPVPDAARDLAVEVSFGGETSGPMPFEPVAGSPGEIRAPFVPTRPGRYTFHVTGSVEGDDVDVEMTSGPSTFAVVADAAEAGFPPVEAPTNEQLAERIEAESARAADAVAAAQAATASAEDAASSARTLAMVGVVLGAIGTIAAIAALAATRRRD